jgi:hypothetical protein
MTEWNDRPFYLHDEQIAYVNGGFTGVKQVENGTYKGDWTDGVSGCLEFVVYTCGVLLAIEKNDKDYLKANPDYLKYFNWVVKRSQNIYARGSVMDKFKWKDQDEYLVNLKNDNAASEIRRILKDYCGGTFLV